MCVKTSTITEYAKYELPCFVWLPLCTAHYTNHNFISETPQQFTWNEKNVPCQECPQSTLDQVQHTCHNLHTDHIQMPTKNTYSALYGPVTCDQGLQEK